MTTYARAMDQAVAYLRDLYRMRARMAAAIDADPDTIQVVHYNIHHHGPAPRDARLDALNARLRLELRPRRGV